MSRTSNSKPSVTKERLRQEALLLRAAQKRTSMQSNSLTIGNTRAKMELRLILDIQPNGDLTVSSSSIRYLDSAMQPTTGASRLLLSESLEKETVALFTEMLRTQ